MNSYSWGKRLQQCGAAREVDRRSVRPMDRFMTMCAPTGTRRSARAPRLGTNHGDRPCLYLAAIGRRNCSATLTCNPLLDEERTVDELYTARVTLNQKSNGGSIQKVDILQVERWRVCALFNFCLQLRQILLLNPATQLKNGFAQELLDA